MGLLWNVFPSFLDNFWWFWNLMKKSSILFKWQFRNMEYILLLPFSFHTPEKNVFLLQQKTFGASYDHAMTTNRFPWSCTTTFICIVISSDLYILRKMPKSYLDDSQKILFCKGFLLSFDSSTPLGTICIKICLSFNVNRLGRLIVMTWTLMCFLSIEQQLVKVRWCHTILQTF